MGGVLGLRGTWLRHLSPSHPRNHQDIVGQAVDGDTVLRAKSCKNAFAVKRPFWCSCRGEEGVSGAWLWVGRQVQGKKAGWLPVRLRGQGRFNRLGTTGRVWAANGANTTERSRSLPSPTTLGPLLGGVCLVGLLDLGSPRKKGRVACHEVRCPHEPRHRAHEWTLVSDSDSVPNALSTPSS